MIQTSNTDLIYDYIELNPRCTRKMLMEATDLEKSTLGRILSGMKNMLIVDIELDNKNRKVEHYTINPHYDDQKVVIKPFEPIEFTHHPVMAHFYGIKV